MHLKKYKALVIEDENDVRKELVAGLNESDEIDVVGEANSVSSAYRLITGTPADVIFLDIKLIEGSSLDLIYHLKQNQISFPPLVITTGYRDFEDAKRIHNEMKDDVLAIMNKPFWKQWAMHKIKIFASLDKRRQLIPGPVLQESAITLPDGKQLIHIFPSEIISVKTGEKRHGKTIISLPNTSLDCKLPLAQIIEKLPDYFIQISRYECINSKQISVYRHLDRVLLMKTGYEATVGETYHSELIKFLSGK
jgi:DNA-binding LytR/AlgR family response regulator